MGLFGDGWTSNLELSIVETTDAATVYQEGGSTLRFSKTALGEFDAAGMVTSRLTKSLGDGAYTLTRNQVETIRFDDTGRLTSFTDRNGYVTTVTYVSDPSAPKIIVTEPGNRKLTLTLSGGKVASVADSTSLARTVSYGYIGDRLVSVASSKMNVDDAAPVSWGYGYDADGRLSAITNPRGHANFTHYDGADRVDYQLDFAGARTDFSYSTAGDRQVTTVTYPPHSDNGTRAVGRYEFEHQLLMAKTTGYGSGAERPRGEVTSDLWCREVPLEGCSPCPSPIRRSSATTSSRSR